jgi:hypothetical protein
MRLAAGLFLVSSLLRGLTCGDDAPACERYPGARAVFTGTVLRGSDHADGNFQRGTLFLVRVVEVFKGLRLDQREVVVDPRSYSQYQLGAVHLFYGGQELPASEVQRDGHPGPWPNVWVEKRKLKVYPVATCGGSKEVARAGEDLRWIRRALLEKQATRVFGATYQLYASIATSVKAGSNVPLEGATVRLRGQGQDRSMQSGVDGAYEFSGIAPGEYRLWAEREPWKESYRQTIVVDPGGCVERALRLAPAGTISGVVKGADGKPAKDVGVELVRVLRDGKLPKESSLWARTDAAGRFLMEGVPAGKFVLGVNLTGPTSAERPWPSTYYPGRRRLAEAKVLELAPNGHLAGLELPLPAALPTRKVGIRVLWADGSAAEEASVRALPTQFPDAWDVGTSAEQGNIVKLQLMQHYDYEISASWYQGSVDGKPSRHVRGGKITLPAGKNDTRVDIRLLSNRPQ